MNESEHRYDRHGVVADIQRVMEYADALGLHGVMILAPVCTTCGMLHQWNMLSDMMDGPNGSDAPVSLTLAEQKAQAARCPCHGSDDYCPCQNRPDATTLRERGSAQAPPRQAGPAGSGGAGAGEGARRMTKNKKINGPNFRFFAARE
jgi:hypothetical protein